MVGYIERHTGGTIMSVAGAVPTTDILSLAAKYCSGTGIHPTPLQELTVVRRDAKTEALPTVYTPSVCFVLQGEKNVWTGNKVYRYNPSTYLVSCLDIPATSQVVAASVKHPFLCLLLELQSSLIYEILQETSPATRPRDEPEGGLFIETVTPELADAFARLLRTLENPAERKVLAHAIMREIHYRLMNSRFGGRIQQLGMVGSRTQRISKVVEHLRRDYATPLKVIELAQMAHMSPSAFHLHFREVTSMSPLQYQKHIRLQEARRLLCTGSPDAASVAYQVGYESPSQFSREYKRFFGQPPMRDMELLRAAAATGDGNGSAQAIVKRLSA
jgi:AraC-like DNA-binding protein